PRTPLHALSLAASPARAVRVAHSLRSFATSTSVVRGSSLPFGEPDVCLDLEAGVEELIAGDRQPDRRHVGNRPEAVSGLVPVERGEGLAGRTARRGIDPLRPDAPEYVAIGQEVDRVTRGGPERLTLEIRTVHENGPELLRDRAVRERGDVDAPRTPGARHREGEEPAIRRETRHGQGRFGFRRPQERAALAGGDVEHPDPALFCTRAGEIEPTAIRRPFDGATASATNLLRHAAGDRHGIDRAVDALIRTEGDRGTVRRERQEGPVSGGGEASVAAAGQITHANLRRARGAAEIREASPVLRRRGRAARFESARDANRVAGDLAGSRLEPRAPDVRREVVPDRKRDAPAVPRRRRLVVVTRADDDRTGFSRRGSKSRVERHAVDAAALDVAVREQQPLAGHSDRRVESHARRLQARDRGGRRQRAVLGGYEKPVAIGRRRFRILEAGDQEPLPVRAPHGSAEQRLVDRDLPRGRAIGSPDPDRVRAG